MGLGFNLEATIKKLKILSNFKLSNKSKKEMMEEKPLHLELHLLHRVQF